MRVKLLLICFLAGAVPAAVAASGPAQIDDLAGVYKQQSAPPHDDPFHVPEDVMEIVKVSDSQAYIRIRITAPNGGVCGIWGVADFMAVDLVYRTKDLSGGACALDVRPDATRVLLRDPANSCRQFCGSTAKFDGMAFERDGRRKITYMKQLLASREYAQAIAERDGKK
jgi:hypothetical protein